MIERKIGEVFEVDGVKLIAKQQGSCNNCYFYSGSHCGDTRQISGECASSARSDGKFVIFIKSDKESGKAMELQRELDECNRLCASYKQDIEMLKMKTVLDYDYIEELEKTINTKDSIIEFLTGFLTLKRIEKDLQ